MTDFSGQYFDRYAIIEPLGEGGMASVYKAYDTRLERDVAVKIIRTDMFIPSELQMVMKRFEREAKSLAKLSHPNIVSIIDYGEHEGVPFLVMEYLPGGTLKDRLTGQPLAWQQAVRLLQPVARALHFSHGQGIIHRDIKPSNILITLSGEPMVSDFGVAKILETKGNTALTGTGVGIGTPEYMAPEQWVGETGPQSDMYSLGVVFYEMVTGHKPYVADTPVALLLKQANEPLPRPRQFAPDLPDRVEKVILKALAKKPENRYPSMQEFNTALEVLLSGPIKIRPTTPPREKPARMVTPPPGKKLSPLRMGEQSTLAAGLPAETGPEEPAFQAADSNRTVIAAPGHQPAEREVPRPFLDEPLKKKIAAWPFFLRLKRMKIRPAWIGGAAGLLGVVILSILLAALLGSGSAHGPAAGRVVYFTSNQSGKAETYYLASNGKLVPVTHTAGQYESWSPFPASGGLVYFTSNQSGKAEIYYLNSQGKVVPVTHTPGNYESWSPAPASGGIVYFTSNQSGKAEIYYLNSKGKVVPVTHTPGNYESWSPAPGSGGTVYFTSNQSGKAEIYYLNAKGKVVPVTHTPGQYQSWSPFPAPGGIVYFTSDQGGKTEIYYLNSKGKVVPVTHTPGQAESWSPAPGSGGRVYFTSNQAGKAEIFSLDAKGKLTLVTHTPGGFESWMIAPEPASASRLP
jgi:serine/threonine protein kinase/Tol biopolymer transport system component